MKKSLYIILVLISLIVFSIWSMRLTVSPGGGMISISLSSGVVKAEELTTTPVYESPTVTEDAINLFTIDFKGAKNRVKIGEGTNNFITKMLFGSFDDECGISLSLVNDVGNFGKATLTGTGENAVINVENNSFKMVYKPTSNTTGFNEQGGVDYFITIKKKTSYNIIDFNMTLNNAVAYHQPVLTQAEINEGAYRPEYVVNSVAFYHSSKGGTVTSEDTSRGITTGKIGHLYAMRVIDANQNQTWAGWTIEPNNILRLTIPLTFLQTATYPVTISPVGDTFGYTTSGATQVPSSDRIRAYRATGAAGTATSISMYAGGGSSNKWHGGLYVQSTNALHSDTGEYTNLGALNWYTATYGSAPSISAIDYYIVALIDANYIYCDNNGQTLNYAIQTYEDGLPDPISLSSGTSRSYSIYCTYTPSGGDPDISVAPTSYDFGVVAESTTPYTATDYFTITNNSAMQTDQTISVTGSTWTGGNAYTHSDTATPGADTVGMKANRGGTWGSGDVIVKYASPNYIYENCPASTGYDFGIKLYMATSASDAVEKTNTVRISAVAD